MTITLAKLVETAAATAAAQRRRLGDAELEELLRERGAYARVPGRFRDALRGDGLGVIAEVKSASPVDGQLLRDLDPVAMATAYQQAGAAAISVLTEEHHFGGSLQHLNAVANAVRVPLLRKDFISQEYQIGQAALAGAAAVLLIADVLAAARLRNLVAHAHRLGMDALVEIHDVRTLEAATDSGSGLIGVNNRNLRTMRVDWEHCLRVAEQLPQGVVRVAESGVATAGQAAAIRAAGYDAVLVGTSLIRSADPAGALRLLRQEGP